MRGQNHTESTRGSQSAPFRFPAASALIDQQQRGVMFLGKLNSLALARVEQGERWVRLRGRPEDLNPFGQV